MCTKTRIQNVYLGAQGACPRQAVTSAGVTAERSERRDVGTGLKLVTDDNKITFTFPMMTQRRKS